MRLWRLQVGSSDVDKGVMLTPGVDRGTMVATPVPAYLIETDDGDRVLIDTGLHPGHIADPDLTWGAGSPMAEVMRITMTEEHRIEHQLALCGFTPDDVTHVLMSHLHFDHSGQLDRFPGRPVLVSGAHLAAARADPAQFPPHYFDRHGADLVDTGGETEPFAGISIIETPGHAPHHRSFLIELEEDGPIVLAIDAILSHHQVDGDTWSDQAEPEAARESAHRLLDLARRRDAVLMYGHDPRQPSELRHAPRFYH
jgi:N-acyl homoserine lactone hydrolase